MLGRLSGLVLTMLMVVACGGGQSGDPNVGTSTKGDDLDVPDPGKTDGAAPDGTSDGEVDAGPTDEPPQSGTGVTFVLQNTGKDELVFSTDRGWQPVIFGFSGKPPKVKPIIMFPKFCTASCDSETADRCPHCPQPERVRDIRKAEKRAIVEPGKTLEVPWDGEVFTYERTKGSRGGKVKRCECFQKSPVPPETYTIRACGLRLTKVASKRSKLQCVDSTMTVPSDEPVRVELAFPDP